MNKVRSDFLFATPTFVSGAARVLDLYGVLDAYNVSETGQEADYKALHSDWSIAGQALFSAMKQFERSLPPDSLPHEEQLREVGQQLSFFS